MILGVHALIYARDAEKARAFFRDVMDWPSVDAGHGWLIFAMPPSELGVHPIMEGDAQSHHLYLMVEDVKKAAKALEKKGVQCAPIQDAGFGMLTSFEIPGGGPMGMYQPRHPVALGKKKRKATKKKTVKKSTAKSAKPAKKKAAGSAKRKRAAATKKKPVKKKAATKKKATAKKKPAKKVVRKKTVKKKVVKKPAAKKKPASKRAKGKR